MSAFHELTVDLPREQFNLIGVDILTLLVSSGMCSTRSEARRAIENRSVKLDGDHLVTDPLARLVFDKERNAFFVIRLGVA
jgi:tyrosyl-tRNA synthetase